MKKIVKIPLIILGSIFGVLVLLIAIAMIIPSSSNILSIATGTKVTIGELSHGTIIANPDNGEEGTEITLTVTPDKGYRLKAGSLKYDTIEITGNSPKFILPASDVVVTAEFEKASFVFANAMGYTITEVEIRPSEKNYSKIKDVFSIKNLNLPDTKSIEVFLPDNWLQFNAYDIAVCYDSNARDDKEKLKWIKTKDAFTINSNSIVPFVTLSIKGEKNTLANLAGGVGVGAGAVLAVAGVASAIVGAPVILIGAAVWLPATLAAGTFVGFSPFVSNKLIIEEIGDYTTMEL
jgi:hypothetical protein